MQNPETSYSSQNFSIIHTNNLYIQLIGIFYTSNISISISASSSNPVLAHNTFVFYIGFLNSIIHRLRLSYSL